MSFTPQQPFEIPSAGQSDYDSALNGNWQIAARGYHIEGTAGTTINTGQVCIVNSAGYVIPYDSRSLSLMPQLISYRAVSSGVAAAFISDGSVSSLAVWSGQIIPGQPVFVAPNSIGFCVKSYAGHCQAIGYAINGTSIRFHPGNPQIFPELVTETVSVGPVLVGSRGDFAFSLANRGIARRIHSRSDSANGWKLRFWTGSAKVNSEQLYETVTRSTAIGSVDINSVFFSELGGIPWYNTDTTSPALVFGRIDVQSGCQVNTAHFSVTVWVEKFR